MAKIIRIELEGPAVREWLDEHFPMHEGPASWRDRAHVGPGIYIVGGEYEAGRGTATIAVHVLDHQADTDDPHSIITAALSRVAGACDRLTYRCDQLRAEVTDGP